MFYPTSNPKLKKKVNKQEKIMDTRMKHWYARPSLDTSSGSSNEYENDLSWE